MRSAYSIRIPNSMDIEFPCGIDSLSPSYSPPSSFQSFRIYILSYLVSFLIFFQQYLSYLVSFFIFFQQYDLLICLKLLFSVYKNNCCTEWLVCN